MSVLRETAATAPERSHRRLSRIVGVLAIAGLAALGGYQLWLFAAAVRAAAVAVWTGAAPLLGQAWTAVAALWHTVGRVGLQAR